MSAVSVQGVGKAFKRYPSQWARAMEWLFRTPHHEKRWVLSDVSFEVAAGTAVGILGANGAGKSTLLKIVSRATAQTTGTVSVQGRVAALLELGMGFHPEFSGRQNALMAGQLLGLEVSALEAAMPEIERFADIGDFIDQPLRTYSSGMQMRLAFSVATSVRPDLLIIDEALSVGDVAFQRKCYQRIETFRAEGTTLLFVSHDIEAVKRLCSQALLLDGGSVASQGPVREVCDAYERAMFGRPLQSVGAEAETALPRVAEVVYDPSLASVSEQIYGTGEAEIQACWVASAAGQRINVVTAGEPVQWCYRVRFHERVTAPIFSMMLKTRDGHAVYGTDSSRVGEAQAGVPVVIEAGSVIVVAFEIETHLAPDQYFLNCGVRREHDSESAFLSRRVDAAILRVSSSPASSALVGPADLHGRLLVTPVGQDDV